MTARSYPLYVTNADGEKEAVIIPVNEYEELLKDLDDLAEIAERREESSITHDKLLKELRSDGKL